MRTTRLYALVCLLPLWGCSGPSDSPQLPVEPVTKFDHVEPKLPPAANSEPVEELDVVAAMERIATGLRKDTQGYLTEINFRGSAVSDENLLMLPKLSHLQSILLNEAKISDAGLVPIGQIPSLTNLDLRDCPISNAGLAHLTGLTGLKALRLSGKSGACTVDDGGLEHVAKLTAMKALLLDFLWVSGDGIAQLKDLQKLEELYLAGTLIGDEDLQHLDLFPNLKKLRISKLAQVTGGGLEQVAKLKHLVDLDLSENSSLFDADLAPLAAMTSLEKLNLWRVAMTDAGAENLAMLTNLTSLNLDNTQLTDVGLEHLTKMNKLTFLHLGSTAITDAGLSKLAGLKSLQDLKVTRTAITEQGVAKLKLDLPNTEIQLRYLGDGE